VEEKMSDLTNARNAMMIIAVIGIILFVGLTIYIALSFEQQAEEKCGKLNLELFDYSMGGFFTSNSITCWNPITKETRIIT